MAPEEVTVLVVSCGDDRYRELAMSRAVPSLLDQGCDAFACHDPSHSDVARARNHAVDLVDPPGWLCFVDADDELAADYFRNMPEPTENQIVAPAIQYRRGSHVDEPVLFDGRDIRVSNPCCIGTLIHRDMFEKAGRFWNERAWEDWSLFRRAFLLGAEIVFSRSSVYVAHMNPKGRNSRVARPDDLHRDIVASHDRWMAR